MATRNLFAPSDALKDAVARFRRGLKGRTVAVLGMGRTGQSVARFLTARDIEVLLFDDGAASGAFGAEGGASVRPLAAAKSEAFDLAVISPGLPSAEWRAVLAPVPVVGEVELASWYLSAPVVGITGTNGKSTVAALLAQMCSAGRRRSFLGGNFGQPVIDAVGADVDVIVAELSSYQLETLVDARFALAAWINLTPDHQSRYESDGAYAAAKARLLDCTRDDGTIVLNADDPHCRAAAEDRRPQVRWVYQADEAYASAFRGTRVGDGEVVADWGGVSERFPCTGPALSGAHNRVNVAFAVELARALGLSPPQVRAGLASFTGLPHRLERMVDGEGALWVNDSKATNVDATAAAVRSVPGPKLLLLGGVDKGGDWGMLGKMLSADEVVEVFCFGAARTDIRKALRASALPVTEFETMAQALTAAALRPIDWVRLFSPGCASFDEFRDFAARGDALRSFVGKGGVA